ncbi:Ocrl [Symbiodinium natans]|uniref:Ocrl protein n=1 Tax=Symbiodinium natans TaxID=878477 RepID=A0A812LR39_9DINO|nr:Ocrl [Symbiodinium natans]
MSFAITTAVRQRLERLLNASEELQLVAAAQLLSALGEGRPHVLPVWLGLGKPRTHSHHIIFVFTRPRLFGLLRPLRGCFERLFCVVPLVANVRVEVQGKKCVLSWRNLRLRQAGAAPSAGDLHVEVLDNSVLLQVLKEEHMNACVQGFVFHEEQHGNHREVWAYQDYLPMELAKLTPAQVEVCLPQQQRRTRKELQSQLSLADDRRLRLLCLTWNVGAGQPRPNESLEAVLDEEPSPDICCIGFQETCQLSARRLLVDGSEWSAWRDWAVQGVREAYEEELVLLETGHLVGLLILVFVRSSFLEQVSDVRTAALGVGVGGYGGNKGAVAVRFELGRSSFCFVNAHLAAGQENYIARCQHYGTIMKKLAFTEEEDENMVRSYSEGASQDERAVRKAAAVFRAKIRGRSAKDPLAEDLTRSTTSFESGPGSPSARLAQPAGLRILDHDHVVWVGDTNSRLHWPGKLGGMPLLQARENILGKRYGELLALDQLNLMRRDGMAFHDFEEHRICFLPSYKWHPDRDAYDMRTQKHVPAWTDRILYRSKMSPGLSVSQYNMHAGLKQSDHRLVFACLRAPCDERLTGQRRERPTAFGQASTLELQPPSVLFKEAKPDILQHCTMRMSFLCAGGHSRQRFEVVLKTGLDEYWPLMGGAGPATEPWDDDEEEVPPLAHWLRVCPAKGVLRSSRPTELSLSLCVTGPVLERNDQEVTLVVRVGDGDMGNFLEQSLVVRAQLEPSVMRAPLDALAKLGRRALLGEVPASPSSQPDSRPLLPPKEVMSVMQWVLIQSRDMKPGTLEWWTDPLSDNHARMESELRELQRYVEHGWCFPRDNFQLPCRSAAPFILRWLGVLPEPIVPPHVIKALEAELADGRSKRGRLLRDLDELPRAVLLTVLCFFGQVSTRHGSFFGDFPARLACALTQQAPAPDAATWLVHVLTEEVKAERRFPPLQTISAYSACNALAS